jgi:hypothetical protein
VLKCKNGPQGKIYPSSPNYFTQLVRLGLLACEDFAFNTLHDWWVRDVTEKDSLPYTMRVEMQESGVVEENTYKCTRRYIKQYFDPNDPQKTLFEVVDHEDDCTAEGEALLSKPPAISDPVQES